MAAKYRKIDTRIWDDEKFSPLSPTEKLVALYGITSQSNRCGIFRFSPALAIEQTGLHCDSYSIAISKVVLALNWRFDPDRKVLFLPTWWKYNPPENQRHLIGCLEDIHNVPQTQLMEEFWDNETFIPYHCLTTFRAVRDSYAKGIPIAEAYQKQKQKQEQKQEQEQEEEYHDPVSIQIDPFEFLSFWNQTITFSTIRSMTAARQKSLKARSRDPAFLAEWREAIRKIPSSPFLRGDNDRKWKATVDFFLQPDSLTKILEGKYDGKPTNHVADQHTKPGRVQATNGKYETGRLLDPAYVSKENNSPPCEPNTRSNSDKLSSGVA